MAGEKCSLTCNVKDKDGKVKVSALWDELSKFFKGDRREAIAHYFLTKDSKFLSENSDVLEFDADGEVTISSLKKALERNGEYSSLNNARTLAHLNRELKAGKYDYDTALDNVLKFNRSNQFRDGFMATLNREEDGKYTIKVVERSPEAEYELADHVQNKIVTDALRLLLKNKGLSVEFLDNPSYAVKYSTDNVHFDIDGLKAVANVINGINSSLATAEAAGHFIVAAMDGNPLIERLEKLLTPEVQKALFGNEKSEYHRNDFIITNDSAKEAAGILVGKALLKPFEHNSKAIKIGSIPRNIVSGIRSLGRKISNFVLRMFGDTPPEDIDKLIQQAKDAASTAAQGYIDNPEIGDVETALNSDETYVTNGTSKRLADDVRTSVEAYYSTLGGLKNIISQLRGSIGRTEDPTNRDIYKKLIDLSKDINANYTPMMDLESFARGASLEGMVSILEGVTNILDTDVRTLLDSIQPSDRTDSYVNIVNNARNMRTVNTTIKNIAALYMALSSKLDSLDANTSVGINDADGNYVGESLRDAVNRLGEILTGTEETYTDTSGYEHKEHGLQGVMELKRRQIFVDAMTNFYGSDYVERNAGVVWERGKKWGFVLNSHGKQRDKVADLIMSLDSDISWFDRYLSSAADCADFATSIGNKATKNANMQADRVASKFWDSIESLRLQMKDSFGTDDTSILYETMPTEDGKGTIKTGNLISRTNYGAWEKARSDFRKKLIEDFHQYLAGVRKKAYENNKGVDGYVFSLTDQQEAVLYHKFVDSKWEKWHEKNSEEEDMGNGRKRYVPNSVKYHSEQWDNLFDPNISRLENPKKALMWYNALMDLKREMDSLLPQNATVPVRAPQVTGRFSHRFRNLKGQHGNAGAFGRAIRKKSLDLIKVKPEEAWMFGSNNEFNDITEDPLENEMYFEKEKVDRIPLFGINKLKDMNNLSTDLFGSLLQYGSMAATHNAMSQIVDIFELGRDVLRGREVGHKVETSLKTESRAYSRYAKFLEKQVYGVNVTQPSFDRRGMLRKVMSGLSSLGGRILLGGNLHSGIVNTGTGMFEIFKEATAGENFNLKELRDAHKMYFDGLLSMDGYLGTFTNMFTNPQRSDVKNALWVRHWNILSENRAFLHNQKYDTKAMSLLDNRLWEWFGHTMMLPYSSGDHYMQTIPYYAMGIHDKVYDHDGNRMNLVDAYDVVDGDEVFAIDKEYKLDHDDDTPLGRTHKKIKLKKGIFRTPEDIDKYDTVKGLEEKIDNLFEKNPNIKDNAQVAADMFSEEERQYLEDEHLQIPTTVKQLTTLKSALKGKEGELQFNEDDESAFIDKCRNICNRLHGIYNTEDKVAFQQNFYGNLVMSMRGYALGMINRRFGESRYNVPQGRVVEGSMNTFLKSVIYSLYSADNWKACSEALLLTIPLTSPFTLFNKKFGNKVKADMVKAGFSEHQYYNMRRVGADYLVLTALALMRLLSSPGAHFGLNTDPDEDGNKSADTPDNWVSGLIYYFTNRWFNEQGAFNWPPSTLYEFNSLLDWAPAGFSGWYSVFIDMGKLFVETKIDELGGNPDLSNSKLYYQSSKDGKYDVGEPKWKIKFKRLVPYYRSWYTFTHPYDAASSYDYGRRVRGY